MSAEKYKPSYTQVIGNITRSKFTAVIFAGTHMCQRVADVRVNHGKHGWMDRTITVKMNNGDEYTVVQYDRGYFELRGPHLEKGIEVNGWADAVKLLDKGF